MSTERDWENQVLKGTGATQGIELSVRADRKKWQYWLSYHKSSSTMTFAGLNEGLTFVSRFDRPLQINAGFCIKMTAVGGLEPIGFIPAVNPLH